ncbi:hypothetical protein [Psychromonas ingrahamii]|uniref:hypothetical protein n=1 Tax=Psychromonas ingrahamii TaxID=357794 RepID=UPI0005A12EE9|nr:hypothetical protein [Psychromonas ingrahamii]
MSYQMMVLTHIIKKKSYCTGNTQFLKATSKDELISIIVNPNFHGNATTTFNTSFRPLFNINGDPNELGFVLFEGNCRIKVQENARKYATGRVCNHRTRAQGNPKKQYSLESKLKPKIITV